MSEFIFIMSILIFGLAWGGLWYVLYKKGYGRALIWTRGIDFYKKLYFLIPYTKSTISDERQFLKWQGLVFLIGVPLGVIIGIILKFILYK